MNLHPSHLLSSFLFIILSSSQHVEHTHRYTRRYASMTTLFNKITIILISNNNTIKTLLVENRKERTNKKTRTTEHGLCIDMLCTRIFGIKSCRIHHSHIRSSLYVAPQLAAVVGSRTKAIVSQTRTLVFRRSPSESLLSMAKCDFVEIFALIALVESAIVLQNVSNFQT